MFGFLRQHKLNRDLSGDHPRDMDADFPRVMDAAQYPHDMDAA